MRPCAARKNRLKDLGGRLPASTPLAPLAGDAHDLAKKLGGHGCGEGQGSGKELPLNSAVAAHTAILGNRLTKCRNILSRRSDFADQGSIETIGEFLRTVPFVWFFKSSPAFCPPTCCNP